MPSSIEDNPPVADDAPAIPSIDLRAFLNGSEQEQQGISAQVDEICKSIGFLIIENHGLATDISDNAWSTTRAFFDLPLADKLKWKPADPDCPRGYFPIAAEALAKSLGVDTPPDFKESFGIGPSRAPAHEMAAGKFEFHFGENLWPALPEELRTDLTTYFDAMEILGSQVLRLFAAALELPLDFFERFHTHPMCALRCINYPRPDEPLLPRQKGAGEHSDYGSITLLKSDPNVAGLEIRLPSGRWAKAPLVEDAIIVNIGDLMARWTNDRWVSTLHRVVQPDATESRSCRRQSMAFFHNTNFDAEIECIPTCLQPGEEPKYKPVQAGEYLVKRFTSAVT
jgi:isopenicillin N synthase-like dioxygenase